MTKKISTLNLTENCISNEGIQELVTYLSTNRSLTKLELNNCWIEHAGMVALFKCLEQNTTLEVLGLYEPSRPSVDTNRALVEMLKKNQSLKVIYVHGFA